MPLFSFMKKNKNNGRVSSTSGTPDTLISIENITLSYDGVTIIDNLSLDIFNGDYLCIIGESGSGKSTVMNAILGLMKPSSGKITYHGIKREQIGVLPQQNPVSSDFAARVEEVVISGCLNRCAKGGFMSQKAKELAFENMARLGIIPLASRPYRDLSGGQRQRVALARALCAAEKMLVLDEPVAGLDKQSVSDIYNVIHDLNKRDGITVVTVTEDISAALKYATKILRVNKDSIFLGSVDEFASLVGINID